jgi:formylmethanofuran dehydrogenase subunit A
MERSQIIIQFELVKNGTQIDTMEAQVHWNSDSAKTESQKKAEICFCLEQLFSEYTGVNLVELMMQDQEIKKLVKP